MSSDREARLLRFAARRQYSVFTLKQTREAGLAASSVQRRVESGAWVRVHRGVLVPGSVTITWRQRVMGAQLACGAEAVCSHASASAIWGFSEDVDVPHVTVSRSGVRSHRTIVVHGSADPEGVLHQSFRVTSPLRTLLDLASYEQAERLEQVLDAAHRRRLVHLGRLMDYLAQPRNRARPGTAALREMISVRTQQGPLESVLETTFFRLLRRGGLPLPVPQHPIRTRKGYRRIDFAYPDSRIAIEVDGWVAHGGRRAFDADRARSSELAELGWRVLPVTATALRSSPADVLVTVGIALGLEPTRWRTAKGL